MRAKQFIIEQMLDEINMSPTSLRTLAGSITGAKAGIEFEMYVPNVNQPDEYAEPEPDMDYDRRVVNIEDIIDFFDDDAMNDGTTLNKLRKNLLDQYKEWNSEHQYKQWRSEAEDYIGKYAEENDHFDFDGAIEDAFDELELTDKEKEEAKKSRDEAMGITNSSDLPKTEAYRNWSKAVIMADKMLDEFVQDEIGNRGRVYEAARDQWLEEQDSEDELTFLRNTGITKMSDLLDNYMYNISWPHYTYPTEGELDIEDVAGEFEAMIGRNVNFSDRYHGGTRDDVSYVVEPDGSLTSKDNSDDGGLEFISPPLPITEMLSDLKKIKDWAENKGCYTNESTGLHINVSIPNLDSTSLDYIKLALLLGDEHVLSEFDRIGNHYAASGLKQVRTMVQARPLEVISLLTKMKEGMDGLASRAVHNGTTSKFVSINNKEGYIEFRGPGGDWLGDNFAKIENTLLRMVVALDAACDPQKYRQEYLTKLYKMLGPKGENDTVDYFSKNFAKFAAGELSKENLKIGIKSYIEQTKLQRQLKKKPESFVGTKMWYHVSLASTGSSIELVATSPAEAIETARKEFDLTSERARLTHPDSAFIPKPVRKFEAAKVGPPDTNIDVDSDSSSTLWKLVDATGNIMFYFYIRGSNLTRANAEAARIFRNRESEFPSNEFIRPYTAVKVPEATR